VSVPFKPRYEGMLVVPPNARRSGEDNRRANSKQTRVLQLLRRPRGATIARARN
jgi:hypothetical protein